MDLVTGRGVVIVMNESERTALVEAALDARSRAYAKYSGFPVGAAVRTVGGDVFRGANVENASQGLTLCAERVAIASAVSAGHRALAAIAVATSGGRSPCGACRQFMAEFAPELLILVVDADHPDRFVEHRLSKLLPEQFTLPPQA